MSLNKITPRTIGQYINGAEVLNTHPTFKSFFPYTGEVVANVVSATEKDVNHAVLIAQNAFLPWANTPATERAKILRKAAEILRSRNDELALQETLDTGRTISETSVVDVISGAESLEFYASIAETYTNQHINIPNAFALSKRVPLGVCAGIGAWNYPLQIACWKAAPALAMGNTMVFKPSEFSPQGALSLAKIFKEAGLPDGVFNVVQGKGNVGEMIVNHPDIKKVSFTGSVPTGKKIFEKSAASLKKLTLELGGKSPLIIFKDSHLESAVHAAFAGNFYSQGEICSNSTRVFVEESILEQFLTMCLEKLKSLKCGDPRDPSTHIGPLIHPEHHQKVLKWITIGEDEGAIKLCGGEVSDEVSKFVSPVIFKNCNQSMQIANNEIFGPVMSVFSFKDENEVIKTANATKFGLGAGVFTQNIQKAFRVADQLETGTCWINNYNLTPINMPFGGDKESGIGRENGWAAIEHVTQIKSYYVELSETLANPFG